MPLLNRVVSLMVLSAMFIAGTPIQAEPYLDKGIQLYNKGDFRNACSYLEQAVKVSPDDPNALYYDALVWHQLKDYDRAVERYRQIVKLFPKSEAAAHAVQALSVIEPARQRQAAASFARSNAVATAAPNVTGGNGQVIDLTELIRKAVSEKEKAESVDVSKCPQQSRVYYTQHEGAIGQEFIVDTQVEGHPIKMVFDTGASIILLGNNHLAQLGLPTIPEDRPADSYSRGVGSNTGQKIWLVKHTLKVGQMEVPNCPMYVQSYLAGEPLLGQTFFKNFAYTIDYGEHSILLSKKGGAAQPATMNDVPFTREGNELVVDVEINGRKTKMYFDTGAMGVALGRSHAEALGIQIPDDARIGYSQGVSGTTRCYIFPVNSMKCGPIEKRDIEIAVLENQSMGRPLLGQTFYGGWQYTIDNENQRIHFLRR